MTDNEIIKAWEKILATGDAPIGEHWSVGGIVITRLAKETLDLINRLKAENERLNKKIKKIKFELKYYLDTNEESGVVFFPKYSLDNLLKEMEGEE